ncbi:LacI family DNA-binding transcriptional regulator [Variovorax sp. DT-64]|uniref:LacI family DNA-binding transcriptional regulator n=1 Tax=Variovorax sp. DT-64 TaxID=3396160 RepID=UPI003F1C5A58
MQDKKITLKDVAQVAGVATGTVSMVLNDSPLVAQATKTRVQAVLHDLGYVYDRAAGNLRSKRSRIVGVSVCNLINPYFADVTAGIQEALEDLGRVLVLGNCAESVSRQMNFLQSLRQYSVEGVLLTPAISTPKSHIEQLLAWRMPVVQVTRYVAGVSSDYVGNDNKAGAKLATRHLLDLGHERIAYLGRNRLTSTGKDRFDGFRTAMREAGLAVLDEWTVECPATREDGFREAVKLMEGRNSPTAILCFNDPIAFGAMLGLRSIGREPGTDCSVVGMDDVSEAALWQPGLTTVSIGRDTIGRAAGRLLMDRVEDLDRPFERVIIPPELVIRSSTCPPRSEERRIARAR